MVDGTSKFIISDDDLRPGRQYVDQLKCTVNVVRSVCENSEAEWLQWSVQPAVRQQFTRCRRKHLPHPSSSQSHCQLRQWSHLHAVLYTALHVSTQVHLHRVWNTVLYQSLVLIVMALFSLILVWFTLTIYPWAFECTLIWSYRTIQYNKQFVSCTAVNCWAESEMQRWYYVAGG